MKPIIPYSSTYATPTWDGGKIDNKEDLLRFGHFVRHPSNPVLTIDDETYVTFASVVYDSGLSAFVAYYHYKPSGGNDQIGRATSSDGVTWTKDSINNPVIEIADVAGLTSVGVPRAWLESDGSYKMLFRGYPYDVGGSSTDATWVATSSDGITWVVGNSGNPVLAGTNGEWDQYGAEIWGVIKWTDGKYYTYYETDAGGVQADRAVGVAWSTDLITWTKEPTNPILTGGRFCPDVFVLDGECYLLCPHYTSGVDYSEFELYRSDDPKFLATTRDFLGVAFHTSASGFDDVDIDTPHIVTDDIGRDTYSATDGQLWMYYAGYDSTLNWQEGLAIATKLHASLQVSSPGEGSGFGVFRVLNATSADLESAEITTLSGVNYLTTTFSPSVPGNIDVSSYVKVGVKYSSGSAVIGYNAEAYEGTTNKVVIVNTNAASGAIALVLDSGGMRVYAVSGSVTAGVTLDTQVFRIAEDGTIYLGTTAVSANGKSLITAANYTAMRALMTDGSYDVAGTAVSVVGTHESTYNHSNYNTAYSHTSLTNNPHSVTATQVGLGNVANVNTTPTTLGIVLEGGGSALTTGIKGDVRIPFAGTITKVTLLADQTGSVVIDLWKDSYDNFPPDDSDSITASAQPTLSSASKYEDSTLTGWTTSVTAGDVIRVNVDSVATITRLTVQLDITRT